MNLISRLSILVFVLMVSVNLMAQKDNKFGHIDSGKLLSLMPERAEAEKAMQTYTAQLENELSIMMEEYEKMATYIQQNKDLDEFLMNKKMTEIQEMGQKIEQYRIDAQQRLQKKQEEILSPIIEKAKNAISEIAKEQGYTYIFDTSVGVLLYWPENSDDILPAVKKKLGIE
ncbi:MAG: OmpH family outer membrane protein [Bacteroidales bacterium]|nr:OmpH family outer membrane protein [Bacteroidales bacterium]